MSNIYEFTIDENSNLLRLDKFLVENLENFTRSSIQKIIDDGGVKVNDKKQSKNYKVKTGDSVKISIPEAIPLEIEAENIPIEIVYEDSDLLVVNKPKGMVVHPANGNWSGTLVNALMFHCGDSLSGINGVIRPGIVHRIDKNTSGLLIVAKNDMAHLNLSEQIKEHSFTREYEAVVHGNIKDDMGTINKPIGRDAKDRKKMTVTDKNSRNAVTHFEVVERYGDFTHVRCVLETGRTHQIRVHMASINHSIAGDDVYGRANKKLTKNLEGQCLHARKIGFLHPRTNEYLEFTSDLPTYFTEFLSKLKNKL